ncbi:MAG: hypothetical protein QOH47_2530 [Sphingomonadales bacterium]|jgi:hypothetical protein|nr:hypothetical protein [Sphingomonadales bacterium]
MSGREQRNFTQSLPRAERIAQLNDRLRQTGLGGRILVTRGVQFLPGFNSMELALALRSYDEFDVDNDPHGERDFGDLEFHGASLFWKIDYCDTELAYASPDPADPAVTIRILTVMLTSEY